MDVERAREDVVEAGLCVEDGIEVQCVGYQRREILEQRVRRRKLKSDRYRHPSMQSTFHHSTT
jgi:hypothetical protein